MPLIKVHISELESPSAKPILVKRLKEVMTEKLQIDERVGQVFLYETLPQFRAVHHDKGDRFVFIEVLMYPGRALDMKASFMQGLVLETSRILNIDSKAVNVCIIEVASENWYGGLSHEYLETVKGKK
jgi:phenylpyruvate tautomerase PptA (4-oxalocrotonate tautomerase family)